MAIYVKTDMNTMPETCMECGIGRKYTGFVNCPILNECVDMYTSTRSNACPLMDLQVEPVPISNDKRPPKLETSTIEFPAHGEQALKQEELEQMEGQPVWVVQTEPFAWSGWMLVNPLGEVAISDGYWVCFDTYGSNWLAYPILPSPIRTLSRSDLLQMHRKPVFITTIIDGDENPHKNWELVFVEKDRIRLQDPMWWNSIYEESENKTVTTGPQ